MSRRYEAFPGMEDILPGEIEKWQWIEDKARLLFEARGFSEIRTPLLEPTELFTRSIGEASDIVHKEMYTFEDRGERSMTLRPEMTASVGRAVIEHGLLKTSKSLRLYYRGPMFRAERPQAGRKRQFHQIGIEIINESGVAADFLSIKMLYDFLKLVKVANPILRLNDLGESADRPKLVQALKDFFSKHKAKLCKDCQWRLEKNVLRILDCKIEACQPVIKQAPWEQMSPLSENFRALLKALDEQKIQYEINRRLVRGLDYYNGIVFEVASQHLGAQDAIAGGGRYDGLYEQLGGSPAPCTGFSVGIERLIMVLEKNNPSLSEMVKENGVYFAPLVTPENPGIEITNWITDAVIELRKIGFQARPGRLFLKLGDHFKAAEKIGAQFMVIAGTNEFEKKEWTVKNLNTKEQKTVKERDLVSFLKGTKNL